jgi:hypothetical protein
MESADPDQCAAANRAIIAAQFGESIVHPVKLNPTRDRARPLQAAGGTDNMTPKIRQA